jgi:hypothetical protein
VTLHGDLLRANLDHVARLRQETDPGRLVAALARECRGVSPARRAQVMRLHYPDLVRLLVGWPAADVDILARAAAKTLGVRIGTLRDDLRRAQADAERTKP